MKRLFTLGIAVATFVACRSSREVQADFVSARLVRIDTIYRLQQSEKVLTWECKNSVNFVSFVGMNENYSVGSTFKVLLPK